MNMLASGFANFINGIFANWQMLLFVIAAVLFVMTILFRKFKLTFVILLAVALAVCGVLLVDLIVEAMNWDLLKLITFLVKWVPTVLFALTVIFATLFGAVWGLRKSLIFLLHAAVTGVLCIILYIVLVNVKAVDGFLLKTVDFFMGGTGALKNALGVTADCKGLKDVFVEWLPAIMPDGTIGTMLGESKAYIYTLADLICHVAFMVVLYVLYVLLNLILYIIYHCCYSERKYKAKITQKYIDNKVDRRYSKHTLGGSIVGLARGIVVGLIGLSFLGTGLFVVAGRGDGTLKDYDFGNEQINEIYSYYRAVEGYGTHGIYKLLNAVSSTDRTPYYLFVADLVLSGELNDEEFGIKEHVVFRKELDAYTGFARSALSLLMDYGGDKLAPLLNGADSSSALNTVLEVMLDDNFRAKFNDLITEFDTQTYVINLALSFVNSAIAHVDDLSFASGLSQDNRDLLKLLFTRGYYCDAIPDEAERKQTLSADADYDLPYINISRLVSKRDVQIVFNTVLDVLGESTATVNDTVKLVGKILPQIEKLSLLNKDRAEELDPVLGRLYTYAANRYLTAEGSKGVTYKSVYDEHIEWISEINSLVSVAESSLNIYNNVYSSSAQAMDMVIAVFDKNGVNYDENVKNFKSICTELEKSKILGNVLTTSYIYNLITNSLGSLFNGIYLPKNITYTNTYNAEGKLVATGEMYNLFNGVRIIGENSDLMNQLSKLSNGTIELKDFLPAMSVAVSTKDDNNVTLTTYIAKSQLLRSVITAALMMPQSADYVYVPTVAKECDENGEAVNLITQKELIVLLDYFEQLVDFILPVITREGDVSVAIGDFIDSSVFDGIVNASTVFEGTLGKLLTENLTDNEYIAIPRALSENYDGWVTANGTKGELKRLINAFKTLGLDIANVQQMDGDSVVEKLMNLTEVNLESALESKVLHYTVSKFLTQNSLDFGTFSLIVPESAQQLIYDDVLECLVKKSELKNLLKIVKDFNMEGDTQLSDVLVKVVKNKQVISDSNLLSASIVYALASDGQTAEMLNLSDKFASAATLEKAKKYNSTNPWMKELPRLIDALDEILGISDKDSFTFNDDTLTESMSELLKTLTENSSVDKEETRLRICYASEIVANNITVRLDEVLDGNIDKNLLIQAKSNGMYSYKELETLSDALRLFDIDVMNMKGDELTKKVKDELLDLNHSSDDPHFAGYASKLDIIYPSIIISGMMSKKLDEVLLDTAREEGDDSPSEPLIDSQILSQIKGYKALYSKDEFRYIIDAISYLGIKDFDKLGDLGFNDVKASKDKVDSICLSKVMRGVFTKQIEDTDWYKEHPLAYDNEIKLLKSLEIKSLVNLVCDIDDDNDEDGGDGGDGEEDNDGEDNGENEGENAGEEDSGKDNKGTKIEDMFFEDIRLSHIKENAFDASGAVTSYTIILAVSNVMRDTDELIIDSGLIDVYDCIVPDEILKSVNAFMAIEGEDVSIGKWTGGKDGATGDGNFTYPDSEKRSIALESEIVRAKLTSQIAEMNSHESGYYVCRDNVKVFAIDGKHNSVGYSISKEELKALFKAMDVLNEENQVDSGSFVIPNFDAKKLYSYYESDNRGESTFINLIYDSDILRFKMCALITEKEVSIPHLTEYEVYDLNGFNGDIKSSAPLNDVKWAIGNMAPLFSDSAEE